MIYVLRDTATVLRGSRIEDKTNDHIDKIKKMDFIWIADWGRYEWVQST